MKLKLEIDLGLSPGTRTWSLRLGVPLVLLVASGVAFAGLPGGYKDGQPLTQKLLDDNFNYLQNQITAASLGPRTPSAFHASLATATSIPTGQVNTPINFDHVDYDLGTEYTASSGTFAPALSGIYAIACNLQFSAPSGAASDWGASLLVNGTQVFDNDLQTAGASILSPNVQFSTALSLTKGDRVQCAGAQSTGTSVPLFAGPNQNRVTFSAARLY